jgi:hypothetical protein
MITEQQAASFELLNGADYFFGLGKYSYELSVDEAIRWLRESKGVHVWVSKTCIGTYHYDGVHKRDLVIEDIGGYRNHDLAQSAGLDAAIEYLKKQKQG